MATEYYRPYLTQPELNEIVEILNFSNTQNPFDPQSAGFAAWKKLVHLNLKASVGIISPAHVTKNTLKDKLELDTEIETPEKKRLKAYEKWTRNPSLCSKNEEELAMTYRYENGFMSPAETQKYEDKMFGAVSNFGNLSVD